MTCYSLYRYEDSTEIGHAVLTAEQHANYVAMADGDAGAIRLGALPHDWYDLDDDYQDTHEDTAVYFGN